MSSTIHSATSNYQPLITALASQISSVSEILNTYSTDVYWQGQYSKLEASYVAVSNQQILQTATASEVVSSASQAVVQASATILQIKKDNNQYQGMIPSFGGNLTFLILFALAMVLHAGLGFWYKQWWVMVSFVCGCGLELAGFVTRTLSHENYDFQPYFLCQIISLTIAPVFIIGGVYILLAKFIVIYGAQFALMKPMAYSYIFMACDFVSLAVQAAGGALAATASTKQDNEVGTHVMVAGLAFQVFSMTVYVLLFLHFFYNIRFFNKRKHEEIADYFNPDYEQLRSRRIFQWFPYVVFVCVGFIYIRCIYRVVELAEGWSGYLITHESFLFFLDALMIALTSFTLLIFHPGFALDGRDTDIEVVRGPKDKANDGGVALNCLDKNGNFTEEARSFNSAVFRRDII
ncbi:unnamed protein product [Wickerhamomyces anomalus]